MAQNNNGQDRPLLMQTANLLRQARPQISALRLDEIKRDVLTAHNRPRRANPVVALRRRVLAATLAVLLFGISTSSAAANILNFVSAGSLGKNVGKTSDTKGLSLYMGSHHWGGDKSDDAGHETYCPDDKGSDDGDASSGDNSDRDKYSDDKDGSSGDQSDGHSGGGGYGKSSSGKMSTSTGGGGGGGGGDDCKSDDRSDEKSDDNDASSGDHSDEKSDDNDASSGDKSDGNGEKSDDNDASSGDHSDEKSDDNDASSGDHSD